LGGGEQSQSAGGPDVVPLPLTTRGTAASHLSASIQSLGQLKKHKAKLSLSGFLAATTSGSFLPLVE